MDDLYWVIIPFGIIIIFGLLHYLLDVITQLRFDYKIEKEKEKFKGNSFRKTTNKSI